MASGIYNRFKANLMNKEVDLEADTIKVALMDDNHSFDETDEISGDIDQNEISGTNYSQGGKSLSNKSVSQGSTTSFDADDLVWEDAEFSAYHAVLYDESLTDDDLICSFDFGGEQSVDGADFKIVWDDNGIITLS
ncbi:MAG: hypothetical protein ACOC5T_02350 [Elusimicrobiota bacterium]